MPRLRVADKRPNEGDEPPPKGLIIAPDLHPAQNTLLSPLPLRLKKTHTQQWGGRTVVSTAKFRRQTLYLCMHYFGYDLVDGDHKQPTTPICFRFPDLQRPRSCFSSRRRKSFNWKIDEMHCTAKTQSSV